MLNACYLEIKLVYLQQNFGLKCVNYGLLK